MTESFKYEIRYWYPHMRKEDIAIWERFITAYPTAYDTVIYDLAVGSGSPVSPGEEEVLAGGFKTLTQRKIDVVAQAPGTLDIIELKPDAGPSALGQVKGYVTLYKRDVNPSANPRPVLITDRLKPDMKELAEAQGVTLIIV